MPARGARPRRLGVVLLVLAAASTACQSGRPAAAPASNAPPTPTTTAAATITTSSSTTTSTTVPAGPPYRLGQTVVPLVDTTRPTTSGGHTISPVRALPTIVWFPERSGRGPLIVFAHGFDVGPGSYTALLESWAAHGYVVAAPEFPLTDPARAGPNLDESDINNQPADVRFVADQLVAGAGGLAGRIDPGRVGLAGHSDGAETVLAASVAAVPAGQPRFRAVIVMSGQAVAGAAGLNPPMLVTQGDDDTINPPSLGLGAYDQAAPPKYYLTMAGAGHLPPYEEGSRWLPALEAVTDAFLDAFVAGDGVPGSVASSATGYPEVRLQRG